MEEVIMEVAALEDPCLKTRESDHAVQDDRIASGRTAPREKIEAAARLKQAITPEIGRNTACKGDRAEQEL